MTVCLRVSWVLAGVAAAGFAVSFLPRLLASPQIEALIHLVIQWGN